MTPIFALGSTVTADTHTERLLVLRRIEKQAAASLADAMADVGDQLLQIRMDLASSGERGWTKWLKGQAGRAIDMGLEPVTERSARNYMALARFRATTGKRFPGLMTLSISCLYPILTLPERALADLAANGVPLQDGTVKPLSEATARELKQAASAIRRKTSAPAPRVDPFEKAVAVIKGIGPLTEAQKAKLIEVLGLKVENRPPAPAPAPVAASVVPPAPAQSAGAAAPVAPTLENVLQVIPGVVKAVEGLQRLQ